MHLFSGELVIVPVDDCTALPMLKFIFYSFAENATEAFFLKAMRKKLNIYIYLPLIFRKSQFLIIALIYSWHFQQEPDLNSSFMFHTSTSSTPMPLL
jgi:hypothetical protein